MLRDTIHRLKSMQLSRNGSEDGRLSDGIDVDGAAPRSVEPLCATAPYPHDMVGHNRIVVVDEP